MHMRKFIIYISFALALMLSAAGRAEAQIADFVPYTKHTMDTDIYDLRWAVMPDSITHMTTIPSMPQLP